jgi:ABC-type phosphate/phosphonate transport system substrate-binding protein
MKFARLGLVVAALALLVACGGSAAAVPTALAKSETALPNTPALQTVVDGWKAAAKDGLTLGTVKPESIVEESYSSSSDINAVADYYNKQLGINGWTFRKRTPGLTTEGFFLAGYDQGNQALIIGAVDLTKFGGTGTYIYLAHGTK